MTKMMTKGANWISISVDPIGAAPLACAKAGVINKVRLRKAGHPQRAGAAARLYTGARGNGSARLGLPTGAGQKQAGVAKLFALMKLKLGCAIMAGYGVAA